MAPLCIEFPKRLGNAAADTQPDVQPELHPSFNLPSEIRLQILGHVFHVFPVRKPPSKKRRLAKALSRKTPLGLKKGTELGNAINDYRSLCLVSRTTFLEAREAFYENFPAFVRFLYLGDPALGDVRDRRTQDIHGPPFFEGRDLCKPEVLEKLMRFRRIYALLYEVTGHKVVARARGFYLFLDTILQQRERHQLGILWREPSTKFWHHLGQGALWRFGSAMPRYFTWVIDRDRQYERRSAHVSPDGKKVLFVTWGSRFHKVQEADGQLSAEGLSFDAIDISQDVPATFSRLKTNCPCRCCN